MNISRGILSWLLLVLLALTSAILCIAQPSLSGQFGILYVGTVYGGLLGVYFVTCGGIRSAVKVITLVAVSAAAWPIAYFGSFDAAGHIRGGLVHQGDAVTPGFPLIAFGGVLGGTVLLTPVVFLFKPVSVKWRAALVRASLGILLSGIAGGIAWELGPTVGAAIWAMLPTAALPPSDSYGMAALFFLWQPVVALFIGWATFEKRRSVPVQASEAQTQARAAAPQTGAPSRRSFVVVLTCLVVLSLTRIIPVRLRQAHRENVAAKRRESRPSVVDLPLPQPMSEEEALILKQIGGYQPGHATKTVESVSHEKGYERPGGLSFGTLYTKAGEPVPQWPLAPKQYMSVRVQQFPNNAWTQYLAEYPQRMYISPDDPKENALVIQFGQRVRSNQLKPVGQTGPLYYVWPSGNCIVTIDYYTPDKNLELVRAYLEKYPSSIP
jgi:hypothetical protein